MKINLATSNLVQEIIFSDSGGKILLDTMTAYPSPLVASLVTSQTLIDVTTIYYDTPESQYEVSTYKAVNPSTWTSVDLGLYWGQSFPILTSTNATVVYNNVPGLVGSLYMVNDFVSAVNYVNGGTLNGSMTVTYPSYNAGNYVYLLSPQTGLYNFHIPPQGKADTVDLSAMDTVQTLYYLDPPGYTLGNTIIAPSDSSTLSPQNMLSSLKGAKLLQGQSLSGLTLLSFGFETPGALNYTDYYTFLHNPTQLKDQHLSSLMSYAISY